MPTLRRASGCLFGLAFGDALAAPTEFMSVNAILKHYPPDGPQELEGNPARVTDDTQMTIAVGMALMQASRPYTMEKLEPLLRRSFVAWMRSPDNNRAPGNTCMQACRRLEQGLPWQEATVHTSKGCGANMRVAPVGLLPGGKRGIPEETRAAIAQFQGAMTHGHPTALAASDLTAKAIALLVATHPPQELPGLLRDYAHKQRSVYHADWLGDLWHHAGASSPTAYIEQGWDECLGVLERLDSALAHPDRESDPCLATGAGWIAEEAFATGLLCFLLFPNDPLAALRRAAVTSGDSDSIACLTGAFAGAYHGFSVWPKDWIKRIEYAGQLAMLGALWE
ncbi:MAG TPA: ADP-ribosylglycohydrolase family protein [Ktedonobacteraceae bacterium]|jgi:ADP-ribosylglycohydrolase|nr:ADP-ribosylglycohydrolase family protein [Ktedonobacteraceae bacterium]